MKPKPVNWDIIEEDELYDFVAGLVTKYHGGDGDTNLEDVNFVLMWRYNIRQDQDGYIMLTSISKSSDMVRELRPHDIVIGINKEAWGLLSENQRKIVIDCQLERIAVSVDKGSGEPKEDERGRRIFRLRRMEVLDDHTMQRRHGATTSEVREFIFNKFNTGDAEEGSYVAEQLNTSEKGVYIATEHAKPAEPPVEEEEIIGVEEEAEELGG